MCLGIIWCGFPFYSLSYVKENMRKIFAASQDRIPTKYHENIKYRKMWNIVQKNIKYITEKYWIYCRKEYLILCRQVWNIVQKNIKYIAEQNI